MTEWAHGFPTPCSLGPTQRARVSWQASYWFAGSHLCLQVASLHSSDPPEQPMSVGYEITLGAGATFADGPTEKTIVLHEFVGTPARRDFRTCVELTL